MPAAVIVVTRGTCAREMYTRTPDGSGGPSARSRCRRSERQASSLERRDLERDADDRQAQQHAGQLTAERVPDAAEEKPEAIADVRQRGIGRYRRLTVRLMATARTPDAARVAHCAMPSQSRLVEGARSRTGRRRRGRVRRPVVPEPWHECHVRVRACVPPHDRPRVDHPRTARHQPRRGLVAVTGAAARR
jgi:hypothetical protein